MGLGCQHELVIERVCAIDVAKAFGKVCVRTPPGASAGQQGLGRPMLEGTAIAHGMV
jgi:hypothetical protein